MKTAIILTGQLRTLSQTLPEFYKNVILPNKENCVLFIACEIDNQNKLLDLLKPYDIPIGYILVYHSFRTQEYNDILQKILKNPCLQPNIFERAEKKDGMKWTEFGLQYVIHGGSILQYYQLWKLWPYILEYESKNDIKFDLCMRTRMDILYNREIHFDQPFYTIYEDIQLDLNLNYFDSNNPKELYNEIEPYVITFGMEIVWFAKREIFEKLTDIIFHYGEWDVGQPFAFNSEHTFQQYCRILGIKHYGFLEKDFPLYIYKKEDIKNYVMVILR